MQLYSVWDSNDCCHHDSRGKVLHHHCLVLQRPFRLHTHPEWRLYQVAHVSYHHRSHRHEDSWSIQVSWPSSPALLSQLLDKNPTWAGIGPNTSCRLTAWHYRSCPCWTWCRVVMLGRASSSWWHFRNPSSKHLVFKHNCVLHGE